MSIVRASLDRNIACKSGTRGLSRRGGALKGCLIALAVVVVLLIAAGVYAVMNWRTWAAMGIKAGAEVTINESTLPQDQKTRIITRIGAVTDEWKDGKITDDQFGKVFEAAVEGPIMPLAMVAAAEKQYVNPSSLSNEDKAAAVRTLQRVAKGVVDKSIKPDQLKGLVQMGQRTTRTGRTV